MVPTNVLGIVAWPLYLLLGGGDIQWPEVFLFLFMFFWGFFGISMGYHRSLSHRSFKMSPFLNFITLLGGSSTAEGPALSWCADHRRHHRYEDTERDPYNVRRSFWWAHMGWMLGTPITTDFSNCPDLLKDPMLRHQYKYYALWLTVSCFGMPLFLGFLLGRPLESFLLAGLTRLFVVDQVTFLINSYAHYFGRRPFSKQITARDSLFLAVLTQGEGWHNYHHRFPFDYRNGPTPYHWDPSKWFIYLFQFLGLTSHLKRTPAAEIYRARIQAQRGELSVESMKLTLLNDSLERALQKWRALSIQWEAFKQGFEKHECFARIEHLKQSLREAKQDFFKHYTHWRENLKKR